MGECTVNVPHSIIFSPHLQSINGWSTGIIIIVRSSMSKILHQSLSQTMQLKQTIWCFSNNLGWPHVPFFSATSWPGFVCVWCKVHLWNAYVIEVLTFCLQNTLKWNEHLFLLRRIIIVVAFLPWNIMAAFWNKTWNPKLWKPVQWTNGISGGRTQNSSED